MRMMVLAGGASLLGGGAYLGGAFDQGEYYTMAPAAVEARLAGLELGAEAGDFNGETDIRLVLRSRGPALLRWDIMSGRDRMAEVRANLSPEDSGTRVSVDFDFKHGGGLMGLEDDPFLNEIAEIAMVEKIDSTLEGRAFDATMMQAKMAAAVAANPQAVANMQKSLQENVAKELEEAENAARDGAYDGTYVSTHDGAYGSGNTPRPRPAKPLPPPDFSKTHADGGWGKKN